MTVYCYDHLYNANTRADTPWLIALRNAFAPDFVHITMRELIPRQGNGVFVVHDQNVALEMVDRWLGNVRERFVVLVGSGDPPQYRSLREANEGETWGFCPWSAEDFRAARRPGIADFIASIKENGILDFSLFVAGEPQVLTAIAILAQGYLIVHAATGEGAEAIPENLRTAPRSCLGEVPVKMVQEHAFWNVFDGKKTEELTKTATQEWKGLGGGNGLDTDIEKLIRAVADENVYTIAGKEAVAMVAGAYKAIEAKLGANRGK